MDLSHLVASVSWWTVWDLPWDVWCGYAALVDRVRRERAAASALASR